MQKSVVSRTKSLLLSFFVFLLFLPAAYGSEKQPVDLGHISVSIQRQDRLLSDLSQNVTVMERDQIEDFPADTPADLLNTIAGVEASQRTEFSHTAPLSIRGSLSRHVLLLVDGIPFNNQISQQADVLPLLPMSNLERIEVVKGAGSSAWGAGLGGVIHLVTQDPVIGTPKLYGQKTASFAGYNTQNHSFMVGGSLEDFGIVTSGEYQNSGGARQHPRLVNKDDSINKKLYSKMEKKFSDVLKFTGSYGYIGAQVNEGVRPSNETWDDLSYYARFGQAGFELEPDDHKHFSVAVKTNRQVIETETLDAPTETSLQFTEIRNHYYGLELKGDYEFEGGHAISFGYDGAYHEVKSPLLPEAKDVLIHAPYVQSVISLDPFKMNLGMRYDANEEFGDQWSPTAGLVYHVPYAGETFLRFNVSRAFDAPPIYWKYFSNTAGSTLNNPNLAPERAVVYEASLDTKPTETLWVKWSVFQSDVRDAIDTVQVSPGKYMKINFEHFRQKGTELEATQRLFHHFLLTFGAGLNDVENRVTRTQVKGRGVSRDYFKLGALFHHKRLFDAALLGRYQRWDSLPSSEPNDRKFIWDAKFQKEVFQKESYTVSTFLNVYNLTNSKYWYDLDFPLPGRYVEGGITISF